uniref:Putative secreted protein n=1 Tax=Anopheles darlingi TaxID=43151 RepID=A0A2M4DPW6_ANODA
MTSFFARRSRPGRGRGVLCAFHSSTSSAHPPSRLDSVADVRCGADQQDSRCLTAKRTEREEKRKEKNAS